MPLPVEFSQTTSWEGVQVGAVAAAAGKVVTASETAAASRPAQAIALAPIRRLESGVGRRIASPFGFWER